MEEVKERKVYDNFICKGCLSYVKDPTVMVFRHPESGDEYYMPCPYCGEDELVEAELCPSCGNNWMQKGDECCDKCQKSAKTMLGIFARTLTVPQLRWLDSVVEGTALEEFR